MKSRVPVILGAVVLLGAAVAVAGRPAAPASRTVPAQKASAFEVGLTTAQEVRNMLSVYGTRVEAVEKEMAALNARLEESQKRSEGLRREDVSALEKLVREFQGTPRPEPPAEPSAPRFKTFEFERGKRGPSLVIPAGSFGEATLLTGVFAPITGEAMPVLLRLDAALVGPQKSRVPVSGAFLVGKAQGDANSRRAVIQLETLSVVRDDGAVTEAKVNGWAVDDDGIQGLRGAYVWRADEILALAAATGALSGGAEAMAQRETVVQATPLGGVQSAVTGDSLKFAGYRSLSAAFGKLSETVSQRLGEIVPAIHVANARRVTVAFISGASLEGYEARQAAPSPYAGLDR